MFNWSQRWVVILNTYFNSHLTERPHPHLTAWQCTAKIVEMNLNGRFWPKYGSNLNLRWKTQLFKAYENVNLITWPYWLSLTQISRLSESWKFLKTFYGIVQRIKNNAYKQNFSSPDGSRAEKFTKISWKITNFRRG